MEGVVPMTTRLFVSLESKAGGGDITEEVVWDRSSYCKDQRSGCTDKQAHYIILQREKSVKGVDM